MKRDIESREDLEIMLSAFYEKALNDDLIRHFFTSVVPLDLAHHLPLIIDFWESVLLNKAGYRKNVMDVHLNINKLSSIEPAHFARWVSLFTSTIDQLFEGPRATLAKQRAQSIATMMSIKIAQQKPLQP
ncbi:MAG TPA: group III truncated hemoglobin [Chitinophagaceae bacterium]|jgi:hemoglobin|nr:group III truncated hemoglobin [Chitinophagaceae bacterium]